MAHMLIIGRFVFPLKNLNLSLNVLDIWIILIFLQSCLINFLLYAQDLFIYSSFLIYHSLKLFLNHDITTLRQTLLSTLFSF